jgi:hypothetical protein
MAETASLTTELLTSAAVVEEMAATVLLIKLCNNIDIFYNLRVKT